jgi:hypothetical protein
MPPERSRRQWWSASIV